MEITNQNEMGKFIRIIVVVVIIFLAFYLLTIFATKHKKSDYTKKPTTPAIIQYEEIILGTLYTQKDSTYYVLVKEEDEPYLLTIEKLLQQYKAKENGLPYYIVDLSSVFNQKYVGEVSSFEPDNLKIKGTTLLKIKDQMIVEHYETIDEILSTLKAVNQ